MSDTPTPVPYALSREATFEFAMCAARVTAGQEALKRMQREATEIQAGIRANQQRAVTLLGLVGARPDLVRDVVVEEVPGGLPVGTLLGEGGAPLFPAPPAAPAPVVAQPNRAARRRR